jgi:hypothetical protein
MPIPTKADYDLAEVADMASSIMTQLRVMQHANVTDLPRLRARLRDLLADYVSAAMSAAWDA